MSVSPYNYTPCNSTWTCLLFVVQLYHRTRERKLKVFGLSKKLQRWKSSINIDLRKWVFSSSLFFFLGCFVFGLQLMMIMQHPPFTYLLNIGNVMQITKLQFLNIIAISEKQQNIKRLLFFLFVTSPKKVLQITNGLQVNDYEIVVKFFHISHNLTW